MHVKADGPPYHYFYQPYSLPKEFPFYFNPSWVFDANPIDMMHSHNVLEIGYCHSGKGIFAVDRRILPYQSGDISIVPPNDMHFARSLDDEGSEWSFMFLDITDMMTPRFEVWWTFDVNAYSGKTFSNVLTPERHPKVCSIVRSIVDEASGTEDYYEDCIHALLVQLAVHLRRLTVVEDEHPTFHHRLIARLAPAIDFIGANYRNRIHVEALSELCHMSYRNFERLFQNTFGQSPLEYIIELRLATICNELKNTDEPITTIALRNGFLSLSSFNRKFKEWTGMAPRDWRHQDLRRVSVDRPASLA